MTVGSAHASMTTCGTPGARAVRLYDMDLYLVLPCAAYATSGRIKTGLFAILTFVCTGQFSLIKCGLSLGHFVLFVVSKLSDLDLRGILHH